MTERIYTEINKVGIRCVPDSYFTEKHFCEVGGTHIHWIKLIGAMMEECGFTSDVWGHNQPFKDELYKQEEMKKGVYRKSCNYKLGDLECYFFFLDTQSFDQGTEVRKSFLNYEIRRNSDKQVFCSKILVYVKDIKITFNEFLNDFREAWFASR